MVVKLLQRLKMAFVNTDMLSILSKTVTTMQYAAVLAFVDTDMLCNE